MIKSRILSCILLLAIALPAADVTGSQPAAADYLRAIRGNDLAALKSLCKTNPGNIRDRLDYTPLHYAALYGSTEALQIVLEAGGDPNARNKTAATPLMYAARSLERTRLLAERGGDVNAKASDGTTALWVAEASPGNEATVRYLIEKGADTKDLHPGGIDYLMRAAAHQDLSTVRLLLSKGLDPHRPDSSGDTALLASIVCDGGAKARLLIAAGADVNAAGLDAGRAKNGPIEATGETPLMEAAACGETETASALLIAGAKIDTIDTVRHMTALMRAVAADGANAETVRLLISSGADVNRADRNSETALDWACKFRNPAVVALLEKAGAQEKGLPPVPARPAVSVSGAPVPEVDEAIRRASALLATSSEVFFREGGGCVGCHHQPFAGRAYGALKQAGLTPEPRLRKILMDGMIADGAREMNRLQLMNKGGGGYTSFLYPLIAMADMGEPANEFTDAMVHLIAESQDVSGAWGLSGSRAPLQESAITGTSMAIGALKSYGWDARRTEFEERISRARIWLLTAHASTTAEEADRLMGLWLAGTDPAELRKTSQLLLERQSEDGGWAQTPYLDSDAFGTAAALYALRKTGFLNASDAAYRRGAEFLLNTQYPDGSWYVRSRVVKLQPYFQSAFPFDHDQWISNSATGYAVMALAAVAGTR